MENKVTNVTFSLDRIIKILDLCRIYIIRMFLIGKYFETSTCSRWVFLNHARGKNKLNAHVCMYLLVSLNGLKMKYAVNI